VRQETASVGFLLRDATLEVLVFLCVIMDCGKVKVASGEEGVVVAQDYQHNGEL
jgi:hypothetical protein